MWFRFDETYAKKLGVGITRVVIHKGADFKTIFDTFQTTEFVLAINGRTTSK